MIPLSITPLPYDFADKGNYYRLPEWSAFRNASAFGVGTLSVLNSSVALWEWKVSGRTGRREVLRYGVGFCGMV